MGKDASRSVRKWRPILVVLVFGLLFLSLWAANDIWEEEGYSKLGIILVTLPVVLFLGNYIFSLFRSKTELP